MIDTLKKIDNEFKEKIIETIIDICSLRNYENVKDFEWLANEVFIIISKFGKHEKRIADLYLEVTT